MRRPGQSGPRRLKGQRVRKLTERPEASLIGLSRIVGTARTAIVEETSELLCNPAAYRFMSEGENPFGDGRAAERIVEAISRWSSGKQPLLEGWQQFQRAARLDSVVA